MTVTAKVRIEGEDATAAAWKSAIGNADHAAHKMAGVFEAAFAGISIAVIAEVGKKALELGDSLNKASIKAGIGGKAMSELAYAAKQSDVELDALSTSLKKMQVNLSEAASGGKAPIATLHALGLEIKDLRGLSADQQFEVIADRISQLTNPADKARAAVELFGKAGSDLLPMFEQGAAGIRAAREEAVAIGAALSDKQIASLATAADSVKRLSGAWQGFAAMMVSYVAPRLTWTLNHLSGTPNSISEQIADQEQVVEQLKHARGNYTQVLEKQAAAQKKLDDLRKMGLEQSKREMGVPDFGAPAETSPRGVTDDAAQKAADKARKAAEKSADQMRMVDFDLNLDLDKARDQKLAKALDEDDAETRAFMERSDQMHKAQLELDHKLSASAQTFKDAFINAFDDMINTGKLKWDELLKYLIAEFAKRGIAKLFDDVFAPKSRGGAGGGGLIDGLLGTIGGLFGGGRAAGGDVQAGKVYRINENGQELFAPGMNGSMIPNHALGGGGSVNMTYNIDARGATMDLVHVLPRMFQAHKEQVIAEVDMRLKRKKIGVR